MLANIEADKNVIRDTNSILDGGEGIIDPSVERYTSLFSSPACEASTIGIQVQELRSNEGLRGIKKLLGPKHKAAKKVQKINFEKVTSDKIRRAMSQFQRFGH